MPIYEYGCTKCGKHHEVMQKITEKPLTKCPDCGGTLKKKISNTSFVLKGTGWYVTDYASDKKKSEQKHGGEKKSVGSRFESTGPEGKNEGKDRESAADASSEKKSDTTKDLKSDSKSDAKPNSGSNSKSDASSKAGRSSASS